MKSLLMLILGACPADQTNFSDEWFLDRLAIIESNNNPCAVGDDGRAFGLFQMHEEAFQDCLAYMRVKGSPYGNPLVKNAKNLLGCQNESVLFARTYLKVLRKRMHDDGLRNPTAIQLYMAWNMGAGRASEYKFNPNHEYISNYRRRILIRARMYLSIK